LNKQTLTSFIAKKYLRYDPGIPFISITAFLAFFGVAIGVAVLIVAMAIMQGMIKEFEDKLFVMNYPITVESKFFNTFDVSKLKLLEKELPDLRYSPFVKAYGVAKSGDVMEGVIVFGTDTKKEKNINKVFNKYKNSNQFKPFHIMIGQTLQDEMFVDEKRLMVIFTSLEPTGFASTPLMKRFKIEGTYDSGLSEYDKAYIYADINDLRKILRLKKYEISGIHILSNNAFRDKEKIKKILGDNFLVVGWWEKNKSFFSAIEVEKKSLFLVLMLIIVVASLNIITSLLMTVMNRRKEIALLLSLGVSKEEVKKIFFTIGLIVGVFGIIAGILLGLSGLWVLNTFDIISLPKEVYGTSKLPLDLSVLDFFSIVSGAFVVVFLSAFYPAKKASEIDVLKVLRNE